MTPAGDAPTSAEDSPPRRVRRSALAGVSYPADADELARLVDALLAQAEAVPLPGRPVALLAPHAALIPVPYSGAVAAAAYRPVQGAAIERVVVLAPSHHRHDGSVLVPDVDAYSTPLGVVPLDGALLTGVAARLGSLAHPIVEEQEHAVEIHLPFLQRCLGRFRLLPLLLRRQSMDCVSEVARALVHVLTAAGGVERTLVVASSDLSHGHAAAASARLDHEFLRRLERLDGPSLVAAVEAGAAEACGVGAVAATLIVASELGARKVRVLVYGTSGDVTGDHQQVVGYGAAVAFASDGFASVGQRKLPSPA